MKLAVPPTGPSGCWSRETLNICRWRTVACRSHRGPGYLAGRKLASQNQNAAVHHRHNPDIGRATPGSWGRRCPRLRVRKIAVAGRTLVGVNSSRGSWARKSGSWRTQQNNRAAGAHAPTANWRAPSPPWHYGRARGWRPVGRPRIGRGRPAARRPDVANDCADRKA